MVARAIFLDPQGTLGGDGVGDVRDFEFYPFTPAAVRLINESPFLAIVVTNQSRIGRGLLTYAEHEERMSQILDDLRNAGAYFDAVYCCPHTAEDGCSCRKPRPGLVERAVREFNVDVRRSYVIGDIGAADMLLAHAIGAKGVLVLTGVGKRSLGEFRHLWAGVEPAHVAENVLEAVKWCLRDAGLDSG